MVSRLFIDTPYLIFQNHETQCDASLEASKGDIEALRELAKKYADIAANPINGERRRLWKNLNDLRRTRPLVWMNEICWNEMAFGDELTLRTENPVCRRIETQMRRTIYQWKHMQGDMVVEDAFFAPYILTNTGFGVEVKADVRETDVEREIASRYFHNQFHTPQDIEKIKDPVIEIDKRRTAEFLSFYEMALDGILPVKLSGCTGFWFAPWDDIVFWMGAENVLTNLATEPEFMHGLIQRLLDAYFCGLSQFERLGLLSGNNLNVRVGSGGYGYTDDLPAAGQDGHLMEKQLWGSATPQIFGSVSPKMHEEFGIAYEKQWLERFGLSYYGCCEPLHNKIEMLSQIKNLRKISISPWADVRAAAELMKGRYVMSLKPNPALLAGPTWRPEEVKKEIKSSLEAARDCNAEIILKDISTVCREPQRLWEWAEIVQQLAESM